MSALASNARVLALSVKTKFAWAYRHADTPIALNRSTSQMETTGSHMIANDLTTMKSLIFTTGNVSTARNVTALPKPRPGRILYAILKGDIARRLKASHATFWDASIVSKASLAETSSIATSATYTTARLHQAVPIASVQPTRAQVLDIRHDTIIPEPSVDGKADVAVMGHVQKQILGMGQIVNS